MSRVQFMLFKMQHPKEITATNSFGRVPIEFPNKNFFTGKLLSLYYLINSNVLFWRW